jgi:hypothetical protein
MASELQRSRDKNAQGALYLWALALASGDEQRITLARSILNECGYPGGEGAPSIDEAMAPLNQLGTSEFDDREERRDGVLRYVRDQDPAR